jgi:hypothetical protein
MSELSYKEKQRKYGGTYKLRNGIIVEAYPALPEYPTAPVLVKELPNGTQNTARWEVNKQECLRYGPDDFCDPMEWQGGVFGEKYDVIEKLTD